ncbi:MAG: hypothetical protein IZT59_00020 [Verrucomicrobia bacterium]|nr:hypothetical protein [Verrucomicrobiota bacterium]|tara:strand:+ start:15219 stop:16277 length:1059 start_codon:yes stop_codon:yes gene_type:complete
MKILKTPFAAVMWLSCLQLAPADTIVLKNGDKFDGKVLREVDGNYILEVKVTDTIRDEKIVAKSDVKYIDKEKEDDKAFKKIEGFTPTPELLPKVAYEKRIEKVDAFISTYPESTSLSKAKKIHDYLTEEYAIVQNGGIKFGEEMVSADDYMANSYEYDATIAGKAIKKAVGRRDFLSALRAFTKYEKTFSDAAGRDEIANLIKQVLSVYQNSIDENLASLSSRMEKRESGLATMSPEDRKQTLRALAEKEERVVAHYQQEKEAREPWVTPDAFHKESLDEARRQVEGETRRLETKKTPRETPIAETYRVAWGKLAGGAGEEKKANIDEAKTNGVPELYLVKLRERAGMETP